MNMINMEKAFYTEVISYKMVTINIIYIVSFIDTKFHCVIIKIFSEILNINSIIFFVELYDTAKRISILIIK